MTQRNTGMAGETAEAGAAGAVRDAYRALQAGDFAAARDRSAGWAAGDAGAALLCGLGRAGAGDVAGGAAALAAVARANPGAQHPVLDLVELLGRFGGDPLPHLRAAALAMPGHPFVLSALGTALVQAGETGAAAAFQEVVGIVPGNAGAWSNLGKVLAALGRFEEAEGAFAAALRLGAGPQIRLNHAVATLKSGRLAEGWPLFRARHELPGRPPAPAGPRLRGLDGIAGRTVLLVHDEGFGDTLQFIRYVPLLAAQGARPVALVPPQLVRLLRGSGVDAVAGEVPRFHAWCSIPDLPGVFGTTLATVPGALPYLHADPALVDQWAGRLPPGRRVGLVWAGEARPHDPAAVATDGLRSLEAGRLGPLLAAAPGVRWVSLQLGGAAPGGVFDPMPGVRDFADTAAIVANLAGVVSVDTAVAHLAGAMGKPVILLDRYDNCWRWLSGREDSPWYPGAVRIVRQERPGDWEGVLTRAGALAAALVGAEAGAGA